MDGPQLIKALMQQAGIDSYAELARQTKKSPTQISNWVHGKENPRPSTGADMARALGIDPSAIGISDHRGPYNEQPEWFKQFVEQQQSFQQDVLNRLELLLEQTAP